MRKREHTRNQRRMYRIHKQDEKILEQELLISSLQNQLQQKENITKEVKSFLDDNTQFDYQGGDYDNHLVEWYEIINMTENNFIRGLYDILYKENKQ